MQSVWSRIWTRVTVSIPYDDNHYTTGTSNTELNITPCYSIASSQIYKKLLEIIKTVFGETDRQHHRFWHSVKKYQKKFRESVHVCISTIFEIVSSSSFTPRKMCVLCVNLQSLSLFFFFQILNVSISKCCFLQCWAALLLLFPVRFFIFFFFVFKEETFILSFFLIIFIST